MNCRHCGRPLHETEEGATCGPCLFRFFGTHFGKHRECVHFTCPDCKEDLAVSYDTRYEDPPEQPECWWCDDDELEETEDDWPAA